MNTHKSKLFLSVCLCISFLLFIGCSSSKNGARNTTTAQFRAASYNIRYEAPADEKTGNGWDKRKGPLADLIKARDFDIVGTQEGNAKQLSELKAMLPGYEYLGHPYGGTGKGDLHNCATFYKTELFEALDRGVFWLSETPDVKSLGWDATDLRICYWTKFKHKQSQQEFYFFNAHFYWKHKTAKEESGPLMVKKIKEIAGDSPVICTGDFNSNPQTTQVAAIRQLLQDAYVMSTTAVKGPEGTAFPGGVFEGEPKSSARIDYLFLSSHFQVLDYEVFTDSYDNGRYPSDHLPVVCTLLMK